MPPASYNNFPRLFPDNPSDCPYTKPTFHPPLYAGGKLPKPPPTPPTVAGLSCFRPKAYTNKYFLSYPWPAGSKGYGNPSRHPPNNNTHVYLPVKAGKVVLHTPPVAKCTALPAPHFRKKHPPDNNSSILSVSTPHGLSPPANQKPVRFPADNR